MSIGGAFRADAPAPTLGLDTASAEAYGLVTLADQFSRNAEVTVRDAASRRRSALREAQMALRKASRHEKRSTFWSRVARTASKVGAVAGIVGGVAAAGVSGGSSLVIAAALAGAALSASSFVMRETGADVELGTLKIGAARLPTRLSDVMAVAAVAAGGAGSLGAASGAVRSVSALRSGLRVTGAASQLAQGGAALVQARATIRAGDEGAEAIELGATAKLHRVRADLAANEAADAIDGLKTIQQTRTRALKAAVELVDARDAAMRAAIDGGRRA